MGQRVADNKNDQMKGAYLGPEFSDEEILSFLKNKNIEHKKIEQEKIRGRAMLEKLLLSQNKKIDQFTINKLSERTNKSIDQIYYEIGSGMLDIVETMRSIFPSSTNLS